MEPSPNCTAIVKRFEGLRLNAYVCPAGKLTIGWGHTKTVKPGQVITEEEAEDLLFDDVTEFAVGVQKLVKVPVTQSQYDAMVSLAFNIGLGAFGGSTLLRKVNSNDFAGAAEEFPRWNRGGGKVLSGLVKRRAAERALFIQNN
jgi:lysozyme